MRCFLIILTVLISCNDKPKTIENGNYMFLMNDKTRRIDYSKERYSIINCGLVFSERFFKTKKKTYSIFLTKKNHYKKEYFLRIEDDNCNSIFDTIVNASPLFAEIFLNSDEHYYYPRKAKNNFAVYKEGSADGAHIAYHIIEHDTIKNKFYYKELYQN